MFGCAAAAAPEFARCLCHGSGVRLRSRHRGEFQPGVCVGRCGRNLDGGGSGCRCPRGVSGCRGERARGGCTKVTSQQAMNTARTATGTAIKAFRATSGSVPGRPASSGGACTTSHPRGRNGGKPVSRRREKQEGKPNHGDHASASSYVESAGRGIASPSRARMTWPRPSSPGRLRKPVWATRPAPEPSRRDQLCRGHGLRAEVEVWSSRPLVTQTTVPTALGGSDDLGVPRSGPHRSGLRRRPPTAGLRPVRRPNLGPSRQAIGMIPEVPVSIPPPLLPMR